MNIPILKDNSKAKSIAMTTTTTIKRAGVRALVVSK